MAKSDLADLAVLTAKSALFGPFCMTMLGVHDNGKARDGRLRCTANQVSECAIEAGNTGRCSKRLLWPRYISNVMSIRVIDSHTVGEPTRVVGVESRNFVLCLGKAYDRSPCGTGTSAKLACLAADGHLAPGQTWRQQGILGTCFEGSYRTLNGSPCQVLPSITGSAFIVSESKLILHPDDPFRAGSPS
jgi:proline racemase